MILPTPHRAAPHTLPSSKAWSIDTEEVIGIRKLTTSNGKELWQVCYWAIVDKEPTEIVTFHAKESALGGVQLMAYAAGEGFLKQVHEFEPAYSEPSNLLRTRSANQRKPLIGLALCNVV